MLNLEIESLINNTVELESLIKTYESNTMTITRELQNAEINWHDDNSGIFFDDITLLKSQLSSFIENLKNVKTKYRNIITEVQRIDKSIKKIFLDFDKKMSIINSYNNAINKLYEVKNKIKYTDISFCTYSEQSKIKGEYSNICKNITELEKSKRKVEDLLIKLSNLEAWIITAFSKISMNSIKEIDYSIFLKG